ncbi:stage II sporulation protein P [Alkalibacillus aidingensis]|uniref:stage II sporulation protein P n=1 Tax=Alkalibacillus aidingensis TaxID=2747607 RepID=UPI001CB6EC58|nr:stage II sporulation protein P [Alkalibacillus aidingensis]
MKRQINFRQLRKNPIVLFVVIFLSLWLLIPLFSVKNFSEASTNILQDWMNDVDGASFSYLMTIDQPIMDGVLDEQEEPLTFASVILPSITSLPYQDLRMLFGHELPNFPGKDSTIAIAGSGTNVFTASVESAPPEYIFEEEEPEEEVEEPKPEDNDYSDESIFIFNSHNRESFLPYMEDGTTANEAFSNENNVVDLSFTIQDLLASYGIESHVDQTDHYQLLQQNDLTYGDSYDMARNVVEEVAANQDDVKYFIDIHRDAQPHHITTTEIDGESVAKLMFVIGGKHENHEENLQLAAKLHQKLEEKYPTISRGVEVKEGPGTNGVFNQDLSDNMLLLEVGGVDNTYEEMNRSLEIFAEVFSELYFEEQGAVNQ